MLMIATIFLLMSFFTPDVAFGQGEGSQTEEDSFRTTLISSNDDLGSGGIDTDSIRASAESFSFGNAVDKIEDISFHMLIVWLLVAGILFFFTVKWAIRLTALGLIGFAVIMYHEQLLGLLLGLVDWIVSIG